MIVAEDSLSSSGKFRFRYAFLRHALIIHRGINEGRQCARDVDTFLTGVNSQLPVTGGIVKSAPYALLGKGKGASAEKLVQAAA